MRRIDNYLKRIPFGEKVRPKLKDALLTALRLGYFIFSWPVPKSARGGPIGRAVRWGTISLLIGLLLGTLTHLIFSFRTEDQIISYENRIRGCPECGETQWRATAIVRIAESPYAYSGVPACRKRRTLPGEMWRLAKIAITAPTKLFFGFLWLSGDLDIASWARGNLIHGNAVGRWLDQNGRDVAECADLIVVLPPAVTPQSSVSFWYDKPPSTPDGHVGPFDCPSALAGDRCTGDGAWAKIESAPRTDEIGGIRYVRVRFVNWYHEDSPFTAFPRVVRLTVYFNTDEMIDQADLVMKTRSVIQNLKVRPDD